jgi:hypothetical protein
VAAKSFGAAQIGGLYDANLQQETAFICAFKKGKNAWNTREN